MPIAKPEYRKNNNLINLSKSTKVSKKITQKQNFKNNITENIKSVSNTQSKPKFIQDRWDIVLKFRKEFQNK